MGLFTTKTKRTYHHTKPKRGWSTTLTAKTRAKRWAKRKTKALWRTTKARIRRRWKRYQRQHPTRKQQIAKRAQQFQRHNAKIHAKHRNESYPRTVASQPQAGSYQAGPDGQVTYQPAATGTAEGQAKPPPPDGAISTCRRCSNEVQYSAGNGRWEHTGHGDWECFQPHRN